MTRMTNDIRSAIRRVAIEASFSELRADHAKAEAVLAIEAYNSVFPDGVLAAVATVPGHWFRNDPCLNFNVNGMRINLKTSGNGLRVPYESGSGRGYHCHSEVGTILAGDLCDRIKAHAMQGEALDKRIKAANRDIEALLASMSSIVKLKSAWPEGLPFYAKFLDATPTNLPAIRFNDVNALLGLTAMDVSQ